jgi:hypothetical protein
VKGRSMPSQSRSQRRRQQQRARSQQRAAPGRTVETRPLPDEAVTETPALTEGEAVQSPVLAHCAGINRLQATSACRCESRVNRT